MFFYGYGFTLSFESSPPTSPESFSLSSPSLTPAGPSSRTMGSGIYDAVSSSYPQPYPQRASLHSSLSLCSFTERSQRSRKDLFIFSGSVTLSLLNVFNVHLSLATLAAFSSFHFLASSLLSSLPSALLSHLLFAWLICLKTDAVLVTEIQPREVDLAHHNLHKL